MRVRRVYFAHPVVFYDSVLKRDAVDLIRDRFGDVEVVDPARFDDVSHGCLSFYFMLVDSSDVVVFMPFLGFVTAGVFEEVRHAFDVGKMVYRFSDGRLELVRGVEDIYEDVLDIEMTRIFYRILDLVDEHIFRAELEGIVRKYGVDRVEALRIFYQYYLDKYRFRGVRLDSKVRWLHWWYEPDNTYIPIDREKLKEVILEKFKEVGAVSLRDFARKMGLSYNRASHYGYYLRGKISRPYVFGLRKLCRELGISFYDLERRAVIGYPVDLSNQYLWMLATHILNEGYVRNELTGSVYVNKDPVLHWYVMRNIKEVGGEVTRVVLRKYGGEGLKLESYIDSKTSRLLSYIGVPAGRKTVNQPSIDFSGMSDEVWRYHIRATLTEEGSATLEIGPKDYLKFKIELGRSVDITNYIPKDRIDDIPTGHINVHKAALEGIIDDRIYEIIISCPPKLLVNEYHELRRRHFPMVSSFPRLRPHILYKSNSGRVTIGWRFIVSSHQLVDLFHDVYGMLPGTWKSIAFEERYKFYKMYEGVRVDRYIRGKLRDLERKYPYDIDKRWIREKALELLGVG